MKVCNKCGLEKPTTEFAKRARSKDGLQTRCKACNKANSAKWYKENQERLVAKQRDYRQENAEYLQEWHRQHRLANQDYYQAKGQEWYEKNRERKLKQNKAWKQSHPDSIADYNHRRRARMQNAKAERLPRGYKQILVELYGDTCLFPGCTETENLTVDHVVPLSKGGAHAMENLQLLCGTHNYRKNAKTIDYRKEVVS